jgi:hypothetical protein
MNVDKLARAIQQALFTNGNEDVARRLVLELADGKDGGGWSAEGAYSAIRDTIANEAKHETQDA